MALLGTMVWLLIGYCMFAAHYGKNKLGGSISDTATMFVIIPGAFLLFGLFLVAIGEDATRLVVSALFVGFLSLLAIGYIRDPETGDAEHVIGTIFGALSDWYFWSCLYRFDIGLFAGVILIMVIPIISAISVAYLLTRFRVRYQKRHTISPEEDE